MTLDLNYVTYLYTYELNLSEQCALVFNPRITFHFLLFVYWHALSVSPNHTLTSHANLITTEVDGKIV